MNGMKLALAAIALGTCAPAFAQAIMGREGAEFEKAIRSGDNGKAIQLIQEHPSIITFRNGKGETPLMVAIQDRDTAWTGYLLDQGADPNVADRNGDTPLIHAARVGFGTGVEWLLQKGAEVDEKNRMGETALIVAVQQRQAPIVKLLLAKGADPDKTDSAAGYSARDYARRDSRSPDILRMIEASRKKAAVGPAR
jgi:ankyrin repeat protein